MRVYTNIYCGEEKFSKRLLRFLRLAFEQSQEISSQFFEIVNAQYLKVVLT